MFLRQPMVPPLRQLMALFYSSHLGSSCACTPTYDTQATGGALPFSPSLYSLNWWRCATTYPAQAASAAVTPLITLRQLTHPTQAAGDAVSLFTPQRLLLVLYEYTYWSVNFGCKSKMSLLLWWRLILLESKMFYIYNKGNNIPHTKIHLLY